MTSFLPFCLCLSVSDLRAKVNPLVVATDASLWGLGVSRTSSFNGKDELRCVSFNKPLQVAADHVAAEGDAAAQRVLQAAWPDVQLVDRVAAVTDRRKGTSRSYLDRGRQAYHQICWQRIRKSRG